MATIDSIGEKAQAAAFRRLVRHLRHRSDAQNVDLMGLAGFCRNCLGDWLAEAAGVAKDEGREAVYGMPYAQWKAEHQQPASPEQIARMQASVARNRDDEGDALDAALEDSFPASDPPAMTEPK
ncbi:DUF1244 domain-containing protein [Sphingomonas sp. VNH70]|uniref:DUF1244 domain-containing protein n=1 Tax=Sphingomonas silueang TaxID=3156617 RepID=UPI0032B599E4